MGCLHWFIAALVVQYTVTAKDVVDKPNLVFVVVDQFRFDAMRFVQDILPYYGNSSKIETPNLDRLAARGIAFTNAYCQLPSCAPSRATLFTGCTVERTGIQENQLVKNYVAKRIPALFQDKIDRLESFEQLLVEERGYTAENYGKWHIPERFFSTRDGLSRVIRFNTYRYKKGKAPEPIFMPLLNAVRGYYENWLRSKIGGTDGLQMPDMVTGQLDGLFQWPYTPVRLDARYGENAFESRFPPDDARGWSELSDEYTQTEQQAEAAILALRRISQPFSLVLNLSSPHPPMLASTKYARFYKRLQYDLFVPPSNRGEQKGSAYKDDLKKGGFADEKKKVQEWTAVYYALVQEVDDRVGALLDELEGLGLTNKTMIVVTADHGEMLGAHGFSSKGKFYDEAARVPLIISYPGVIPEGEIIDAPVSHLNVFSTVLDYLNAGELDNSDGRSLRPLIEDTAYNARPDESVVVAELDQRIPINASKLSGTNGDEPNFMIRYGDYKLMMPKMASSTVPDMMFDLSSDPFEMNNLLRGNPPDWVIGKAEQLKLLLVNWMKDKDGPGKYYSAPKWNGGEGRGDIKEVQARRTWKSLDYWQSDRTLGFGMPRELSNGNYTRKEYLDVGRSTPGKLTIQANVVGPDKEWFTCSPMRAKIKNGGSVRITVSYDANQEQRMKDLNATIEISVQGGGVHRIPIVASS